MFIDRVRITILIREEDHSVINPILEYAKQRSHKQSSHTPKEHIPALVGYDDPNIHIGGHIGNTEFVFGSGSVRNLCVSCGRFFYDDAPNTRVSLHCPFCGKSHFRPAPRVLGDNVMNVITDSTQDENVDWRDLIEDSPTKK